MKETFNFCKQCNKPTMHIREQASNKIHLVLSILTVGCWLPVWFYCWVRKELSPKVCKECGSKLLWTDETVPYNYNQENEGGERRMFEFCKKCDKPTIHTKPKVNHWGHFFLTILTFGVWGIVWIIIGVRVMSKPKICTICKTELPLDAKNPNEDD